MTVELEYEKRIKTRLASIEDAEAIAQLSHQLGYPVSQEQMRQRLKRIQQQGGDAVYVAAIRTQSSRTTRQTMC